MWKKTSNIDNIGTICNELQSMLDGAFDRVEAMAAITEGVRRYVDLQGTENALLCMANRAFENTDNSHNERASAQAQHPVVPNGQNANRVPLLLRKAFQKVEDSRAGRWQNGMRFDVRPGAKYETTKMGARMRNCELLFAQHSIPGNTVSRNILGMYSMLPRTRMRLYRDQFLVEPCLYCMNEP